MPRLHVCRRPLDRPTSALVLVCAAWKALLLLIAFASPGPGYDTSTTLLLGHDAAASSLGAASAPWSATLGERLVSKLVRWDAIYFTAAAARGYQHEQEWAFSWAFSHLMANAAKILPLAGDHLAALAWAGVVVSNASHLLSVLVLYQLVRLILPEPALHKTAFLTAVLHALSPAGLFLAAPYGEALFSLLNFSGMLCYAYARVQPNGPLSLAANLLCMLTSGLCFGLATMVRSNGLLSGLILIYDVVRVLPGLLGQKSEMIATLMRLTGTVLAGCMVAGGSIIPQWVAYLQYCTLDQARPWCTKMPPSIYTWVQHHYWNVGFLRYWTLSNIPLFLLAAPTIWVLVGSALRVIRRFSARSGPAEKVSTEQNSSRTETAHLLVAFSIPQLALALLAVTNFHIQIVNRISSGYPLWYLAIASGMDCVNDPLSVAFASKDTCNSLARLMVIYAIVQGALFASFLPPA
ncbi:glycosyltransferase family 76 protein [Diplodia corticola]|uniref:GPI mannosyltransferase 2 n=1 Tax=Diplodia corticola TaxID=236234 RepID=A0A1J9SM22_9PEZI|nr:glycosyltransferase family 76 protein [Diplodia corticola]OJD40661.1 glycosyltransferase family 76 protein [Diplodia corticola]